MGNKSKVNSNSRVRQWTVPPEDTGLYGKKVWDLALPGSQEGPQRSGQQWASRLGLGDAQGAAHSLFIPQNIQAVGQ